MQTPGNCGETETSFVLCAKESCAKCQSAFARIRCGELLLDPVLGRVGGDGAGVLGRILFEILVTIGTAEMVDLAAVDFDEVRSVNLVAADGADGVVQIDRLKWGRGR